MNFNRILCLPSETTATTEPPTTSTATETTASTRVATNDSITAISEPTVTVTDNGNKIYAN